MKVRWFCLLIAGAVLLGGCAAAPKDGGFDPVRQTVADRTSVVVQWDQNTDNDKAVQAAVQSMLAEQLTVDRAVQIALLNNRNLQAEFEELGIAQSDFVQAGLLKNPVFDLSVRFPDRSPSRTYLDFSVAEDFISVFFIPARQKLAGALYEQKTAEVTGAVLNLAADTKTAFFKYQAAAQLVGLRKTISVAESAAMDAAQRLHDAGNTTDLDLLNAKAQAGRAKVELSEAETAAAEARENLNELMGLWGQQTDWAIADHLPDVPESEIQAADLEGVALRDRADLTAARQAIEVQAEALGFTVDTRYFSDLTIGAEAERETDGQWRIGPALLIPIPLFDRGQAAIPRAEAMLRQSRERYWALAVSVRAQVRAARARLFGARSRAIYYRDQLLPLQHQVVEQTQLQYNGMLAGVFELLQARRDEIDTRREFIDSLRDYWIARSMLERAVGGKLPPSVASTEPATLPTVLMHDGAR